MSESFVIHTHTHIIIARRPKKGLIWPIKSDWGKENGV